jgi:type IV secretory pathway VirB3-like protein
MAGLVPAIHVCASALPKTWMPATSAGMTGQSLSPLVLVEVRSINRRAVTVTVHVIARLFVVRSPRFRHPEVRAQRRLEGRLLRSRRLQRRNRSDAAAERA